MKLSEAQDKMTRLENLSNVDLLERALQELRSLCGSEGRAKTWLMSIPVDADRDSDVLFGEVLMRFAQLEATNEALIRVFAASGPLLRNIYTSMFVSESRNEGLPPQVQYWLQEIPKFLDNLSPDAKEILEESDVASSDSAEK